MIQLWSTWNFSWFVASYNKLLPYDGALKCSIVVTSIIGGYMIYIYPRKFTIRIGSYKIRPSYHFLVITDLIVHQWPMAHLLYVKYTGKTELITNDNCGVRFLIPATSWLAINHIRKINMDRIYGIKIKNILVSGGVIFLGYSFIHHYFKK
jgi:hypothetical protein